LPGNHAGLQGDFMGTVLKCLDDWIHVFRLDYSDLISIELSAFALITPALRVSHRLKGELMGV
jgi:hypothetical protein